MTRPTRQRISFAVATLIVHFLVCMFVIIPMLHDMDNWALWKYALLVVVFMFVAQAISEVVAFMWDLVAEAITAWRARK